MCRTIHRAHKRLENTYLQPYPGYYFTGDGAYRDADGHYWITGRVDDTLNVSGKFPVFKNAGRKKRILVVVYTFKCATVMFEELCMSPSSTWLLAHRGHHIAGTPTVSNLRFRAFLNRPQAEYSRDRTRPLAASCHCGGSSRWSASRCKRNSYFLFCCSHGEFVTTSRPHID